MWRRAVPLRRLSFLLHFKVHSNLPVQRQTVAVHAVDVGQTVGRVREEIVRVANERHVRLVCQRSRADGHQLDDRCRLHLLLLLLLLLL